MKLGITGASNFVNRMFEACGPFQWAREFLKNAQEAGATRVDFGIEWQAVQKLGVYRRTIADNGSGMSAEEIYRFFSKLGEGGKPIGGVHDNFGVGAKIASLPWNPDGVVVLSWKDGKGSMIWMRLDPDSGDYELLDFEGEQGKISVVDPEAVLWTEDENDKTIDWGAIKPDWISDHGTVVILLGSAENQDTVLGNRDSKESSIKGLTLFLNTRFWDLSGVDVGVVELSTDQKNQWPTTATGTQRRRAMGALYFLTEVSGKSSGHLDKSGTLFLDEERVATEWYLWKGERPHVGPYAKQGGYIAVRYNGELFHLSSSKIHFRWFGIIETEVQQCTTIILEPRHYHQGTGKWGVHPDQSRSRLIFSGGGIRGGDVPLSDWGLEFAENMPEPIRQAILDARGNQSGELQDEEYRRRLQDKFGDRWRTRRLVVSLNGTSAKEPATPTDDEIEVHFHEYGQKPSPKGDGASPGHGTLRIRMKTATPGGDGAGVPAEAPVDVPRYDFKRSSEFEKPWHIATWMPNDVAGPTVYINVDSGILQEVIEYHQEQYPEIYHEEVAVTIRRVFGEVAACKVAHAQKLTKEVSIQDLDSVYRSEAALTVSLMGLISEESLIAQRLGKLGKKKAPAA